MRRFCFSDGRRVAVALANTNGDTRSRPAVARLACICIKLHQNCAPPDSGGRHAALLRSVRLERASEGRCRFALAYAHALVGRCVSCVGWGGSQLQVQSCTCTCTAGVAYLLAARPDANIVTFCDTTRQAPDLFFLVALLQHTHRTMSAAKPYMKYTPVQQNHQWSHRVALEVCAWRSPHTLPARTPRCCAERK